MNNLLVVCPTRGRPDRLAVMLQSFFNTSAPMTRMFVYVADDDPCENAYLDVFKEWPVWSMIGPRVTCPEIYNIAQSMFTFPYYSDANDDFVYKTRGWDSALIALIESNGGVGMACGRTRNLPMASVYSAASIEALGYWMPPGFKHQFVDDVHQKLYGDAGLLYRLDSVEVEHRHFAYGLAHKDATYDLIYNDTVTRDDRTRYEQWLREEYAADLEKLKSCSKLPTTTI